MDLLIVFVVATMLISVILLIAPFIAQLMDRYYGAYCSWAEAKIKAWRG